MENFEFHGPSTLDEAQAAMRAATDGKFMAGGQSLLPVMKLDLAAPSDVISLAAIEALGGIGADGTMVTIGAAVTHAEVHESDAVRQAIPALADLAGGIGDPQVRNRGDRRRGSACGSRRRLSGGARGPRRHGRHRPPGDQRGGLLPGHVRNPIGRR